MVRHASAGPPPPENAQRVAGRDNPPQRAEVRPPLLGPARRALTGGTFQRAAKQAGGTQVRYTRLYLRQIFAAPQSWLVSQSSYITFSCFFCVILLFVSHLRMLRFIYFPC